jgi:hypothetical protein
LSIKNKKILTLVKENLEDKIYIYKEKIGFNNVNEYQLKSIKN